MWPGVREGFQRTIEDETGRKMTLETLQVGPVGFSDAQFRMRTPMTSWHYCEHRVGS